MTARLRLLKVHVRPVFVADDGDSLTEVAGQPIEVTGANWRTFAATAFGPEEMTQLQQQWDAAQQPPSGGSDHLDEGQ